MPARSTTTENMSSTLAKMLGPLRMLWRVWPLTWLGALVLLAGAAGFFWLGQPRADYVFQVVGLVAMALSLLAMFSALFGAFFLHRKLSKLSAEPILHLEAEQRWPTGV